ncbi:unnamed protein product [Ectocarpus sp. 13 AM-2016]
MERDIGSGTARPDKWASVVTSGDAVKLAELVLLSSGSSLRLFAGDEACIFNPGFFSVAPDT